MFGFSYIQIIGKINCFLHCSGEDSVEILEKVVQFLLYSDYRYNYLFLHCGGEDNVEILEKVVRFLLYSDYRYN